MGYGTDGLTFNALRSANERRAADDFKECGDWTPAQWLQAMVSEVGEYANLRKKYERDGLPDDYFLEEAAKELADIQCYLDLLALSLGIDLGRATMDKWNAVSRRRGSRVRLRADDWYLANDA